MAPGLENVANAIAFAREQFLHGEQPSGPIRHEIFTSWRRSALSGADPDIATFPYSSELDLGGRLTKAAYPVLDRLAERLESTGTAVLLADKDARILNRWAADPELLRMMDRSDSAPGFSLIEDVCGTNGLGSVVEERRPMYVCGAEHFAERFINYACYGAPIINPLTGRLEGAVTLVCNSVDASPLMMPFVQEMSGAIEDRLRSFATLREQALLDAFTKAAHGARRPVIAVNDKTIITNPLASRLLEGVEHATLWEYAAAAISTRRPSQGAVRTPTGIEIHATFRPLLDGGEVLGAIGELDPTPMSVGIRRHRRRCRSGAVLVGFASLSADRADRGCTAWSSCTAPHELTNQCCWSARPARASCSSPAPSTSSPVKEARPTSSTPRFAAVDGAGVWLRRVKSTLGSSSTLILRHLEVLDRRTSLALASLLEENDGPE